VIQSPPLKEVRMKFPKLMVLIVLLGLVALPLAAQNASEVQATREAIRANKKLVVAHNMNLTETEDKAFWPLYDQYQAAIQKLNDRRYNLIMEYAKNYNANTITDENAASMQKEALSIETDRVALKNSYVPKFAAVLPPKKNAKYFQIENKVESILLCEIYDQIPLVK
jgi:hypothetical protein